MRRLLILLSAALVATGLDGAGSGAASRPPLPRIGVNFHGTWSTYPRAQQVAVMDKLKAAGVRWVRIDMGWRAFQERGPTSISSWYVRLTDRLVALARARHMRVLGMIHQTPAWANGGQGATVPPSDPQAFGWFGRWLAKHFRGRVSAWEVWNEPDPGGPYWSAGVPQYVQLLQVAYRALKQGDPRASVLVETSSSEPSDFLTQAYAAGAGGSFDAVSVHPYSGDAPPEDPEGGFARVDRVRAVMQAHDDRRPIWFTEFGWSAHDNSATTPAAERGVTLVQQAAYLVRALRYCRVHYPYVSHVFWYTDVDRRDSTEHENHYGLLTVDLKPKPVYRALRRYLSQRR
jgi:polysaccharide biosynthesis protein PslG